MWPINFRLKLFVLSEPKLIVYFVEKVHILSNKSLFWVIFFLLISFDPCLIGFIDKHVKNRKIIINFFFNDIHHFLQSTKLMHRKSFDLFILLIFIESFFLHQNFNRPSNKFVSFSIFYGFILNVFQISPFLKFQRLLEPFRMKLFSIVRSQISISQKDISFSSWIENFSWNMLKMLKIFSHFMSIFNSFFVLIIYFLVLFFSMNIILCT